MKIVLIGDIHGDLRRYKDILDSAKCDMSIQLGDFGIGFGHVCELSQHFMDPHHKFICGNHDNRMMAGSHPNYLGHYGFLPEPKVFYVGGAETPEFDRRHRTPGVNWWFDEELSEQEMKQCLEHYKDARPNIVLSHDAPLPIVDNIINMYTMTRYPPSRTQILLSEMFKFHKPQQWYFGHWHINHHETFDGTEFYCIPPCKGVEINA